MADDPFKDYGLMQRIKDMHIGTALWNPQDVAQHINFPEAMRSRMVRMDPGLGPRVDRGILDMAVNFAGGYDWAAREGISPEVAMDMAKAYQYGDYADRPEDSIQDYYENVDGIKAFTGDRMSHESLINMALEYARKKAARSKE